MIDFNWITVYYQSQGQCLNCVYCCVVYWSIHKKRWNLGRKYRLSQVKCVKSVGTRFPAIVFKGFLKEKLSLSEMKFKNFKNIFRFNLEKITLYSWSLTSHISETKTQAVEPKFKMRKVIIITWNIWILLQKSNLQTEFFQNVQWKLQ